MDTLTDLRNGGRDDRGRFQPGNVAALRHGQRLAPDHCAIAEAFTNAHTAIVRDLGDDLSAMAAGLARELARVDVLVDLAGNDLAQRGMLAASGRVRAMLGVYQGLLDRQIRLAGQLGLERRAKPTRTLVDWSREKGGTA